MAVTSYHSVGGVILGESTGGARTDYAPDALGSVAATVDQSGAVVNQYAYKPYGSQLSKSGAGADPAFRWVGTLIYRNTTRHLAGIYVPFGTYDTITGRSISEQGLSYYYSPISVVDGSDISVDYDSHVGKPDAGKCGQSVWFIKWLVKAFGLSSGWSKARCRLMERLFKKLSAF